MPKYLSRSKRLSNALGFIQDRIDQLQAIVEEVQAKPILALHPDDPVFGDEIKLDEPIDPTIDTSEIQDLFDEIDEWRSNMEGTNLEQTSKYSDLQECADNLQTGIDALESLTEVTTLEDLESLIEEMQTAIDELESVDFPGMY